MNETTKHIPSQRLKTWHRHSGRLVPLKVFARTLLTTGTTREIDTVNRWLAGKASA